MSERDTLLNWLDRAAARVRYGLWLRDSATLVCALLALAALHQGLRAAIGAPEVLAALAPFFLFAVVGAVALFALRLWRRPTLEQAARAADTRAGLSDELRSALWFAQRSGDGPLVELLVARASRTVRALDARRLFPLAIPRGLVATLTLALLAVALASFLPGNDLPAAATASVSPASPAEAALRASQAHDTPPVAENDAHPSTEFDRTQAAWTQIQELASALTGDGEEDIGRAIAARDAGRAAQLLQALQQRQAAQPTAGPAARPQGEQMSATLAEGILERLKDLLRAEAAQPDAIASDADAPTARLTEELRADTQPEKGDPRDQQSAGETVLNEMLRAINRSSIGRREVAGGAGEAAQEGGRSNIGGGAMGRRVGVSRAGAQDGERPQGAPTGDAESEPVLGQKTLRLEAQLQKVKVEAGASEDQPGGEQALYAQTRAQAARLGYEAVDARPRQGLEAVVSGESTPLAYRDAVKRYMLEQHGKQASGPDTKD